MIGRRARLYRGGRPVLIPAPFSENSISLPLRAAGRGAGRGGGGSEKRRERSEEVVGGARERRKGEGWREEKLGRYIIADNAGPYTYTLLPLPSPSPSLPVRGQKVICQLIHAYRAWLFAMNTHGGGKKARWPFNAVALR